MAEYPCLDPDPVDPYKSLLVECVPLLREARRVIAPIGPRIRLEDMARRIEELMAERAT